MIGLKEQRAKFSRKSGRITVRCAQGPRKTTSDPGAVGGCRECSRKEPASLSAECWLPWALNFLGYIIHLELVFQLDPRNGCAGVLFSYPEY